MVIAVPPIRGIYVIVLVHAIVSGYHGWSHIYTMVSTTLAQNIFIATVVFASPPLAVVLLFRRRMNSGCAIFSFSMLSSFVFGIVFHFILDTRDLYSNVHGIGSRMFLVSAVLLAAVEFIGFMWGAYCWRCLITRRSSGPLPAAADV